MHQPALIAALTASLAALPGVHAGFYTKNSPVLQLDAGSYDRLIAKSNHTSIVEFYAPWCGHCQNLKPAYEKAAKNLDGLAKVAAVDCDEETNKQFCGTMGIQGFPTLKIVRPGKKFGKPVVEDYQGPRTASGIVEAVVGKINNHVTRLTDKELDGFLEGISPRLYVISVGQVRNKEKAAVEKFGITSFPKFVLIPGDGKDPITYDGDLNKKDLLNFLKRVGAPNPDPAPASSKADKKSDKKSSKAKDKATQEAEPSKPTETPTTAAPEATSIDIAAITTKEQLGEQCFQPKSHTCVLALVPSKHGEVKDKALHSLNQLNTKYIHGKRHAFPFFSVSTDVDGSAALREALGLKNKVEIVVVNARRAWWRRYDGDMGVQDVEAWLDTVRMGEGEKTKLPKELIVEAVETTTEEATQATDPEPEVETEHDEL
ncbi:Putative protein disulfide-isomerase [Cladobotryum mycophilum]|uniref:protein disulfide-isomerase n=1 Tax=Cladobotryum mycophilum TaxID=491253 RepID=A0ABR0S4G8_9HYPO